MPQSEPVKLPPAPRTLTLVVAGWAVFGVAAAMLAIGALMLVPLAWVSMADALSVDRDRALRDAAVLSLVLMCVAGLAFVVAWGLHGLRGWAWWLALGASVGLAALFGGRLAATHDPLFGLLIGLVLAGSAAIARPSVRSCFDVRR